MIGHTKSTAGAAGLVKVALSLHDRILPPHLGVTQPNPALQQDDSPLYVNNETRPWVRSLTYPRRAGVSSFGFGGTNFHVVLEEYQDEFRGTNAISRRKDWPAELFVWRAPSREQVLEAVRQTLAALKRGSIPRLADLAASLAKAASSKGPGAAIVARSLVELESRLDVLIRRLNGENAGPSPGVYYEAEPLGTTGPLAVLFSGQGSQYPEMLRDLTATFTPLRETLELADRILASTPTFETAGQLTQFIYPPDRFTPEAKAADAAALTATDVAQPALGATSIGLWRLLQTLGLRAGMLCGHSYGEFTALHAAGVLSLEDLFLLSEARGRFIAQSSAAGDLGTMAAVMAGEDIVCPLIDGIEGVVLANYNSPSQIIISGPREALAEALRRLESGGVRTKAIPVSAAFHSSLMRPAQQPLADRMAACRWSDPGIAVYSNTTGGRHGSAAEIRELMARHLLEPVLFRQMIETMYADGARVFLEVGPRSVLADLVRANLGSRPGVAVAIDGLGGGFNGFLGSLGALFAHGVDFDVKALTAGRTINEFDAVAMPMPVAPSPTLWMINGGQSKPGTAKAPVNLAPTQKSVRPTPNGAALGPPNVSPATPPSRDIPTSAAARPPQPSPPKLPAMPGSEEDYFRNDFQSRGVATVSDRPDGYGNSDPQTSAVLAQYFSLMRQFVQAQENVVMGYLGVAHQPPEFGASANLIGGRQAANGFLASPQADWASPALARGASNGHAANGHASNGHAAGGETAPAGTSTQGHPIANGHAMGQGHIEPPSVLPSPAIARSNGTAHNDHARANGVAPPSVESMLVALVSDRTGYPEDMLALDADIEADLGIDSIKRVEILGALRKELPDKIGAPLEKQMSALSKAKSLSAIVAIVKQCSGGAAGEANIPFV